jgi:hypothetical protein
MDDCEQWFHRNIIKSGLDLFYNTGNCWAVCMTKTTDSSSDDCIY